MIVEMLFTGIKDMTKLYKEQLTTDVSPFGGDEPTIYSSYQGKVYCEQVLRDVSKRIPEICEFSYQGEFGRVANENFVVLSDSMMYTISCTVNTYEEKEGTEEKTARLTVKIDTEKRNDAAAQLTLLSPGQLNYVLSWKS